MKFVKDPTLNVSDEDGPGCIASMSGQWVDCLEKKLVMPPVGHKQVDIKTKNN